MPAPSLARDLRVEQPARRCDSLAASPASVAAPSLLHGRRLLTRPAAAVGLPEPAGEVTQAKTPTSAWRGLEDWEVLLTFGWIVLRSFIGTSSSFGALRGAARLG